MIDQVATNQGIPNVGGCDVRGKERIDYAPDATPEQIAQGEELLEQWKAMTDDEREAQRIADSERGAMVEEARIQSLLPSHGQSVATLVQCLAQFGLALPVDFSDAVDTMFVTLETSPELSRWAMLAQTTYIGLQSAGLSDHDIYVISEELI